MKLVIVTCNKYSWIVPIFKFFYEKNWPDSPYQVETLTETNTVDYPAFLAGKGSWAGRLIRYLEQSDEDKILFTLEDYLIQSKVDTARVRVAEKLCEGDVGYVRLSNGPYKYFEKHTAGSPDIKGFKQYPLCERFSMVVHMGFFQKQFLLDVLKDGEDTWETENKGSVRLREEDFDLKWRVLWPKTNIINYMANGGLMKKGKPRPQCLKWVLSEFANSGERGLSEIIRVKECLES